MVEFGKRRKGIATATLGVGVGEGQHALGGNEPPSGPIGKRSAGEPSFDLFTSISGSCLFICIVIFALQSIPIIGIFIMMMLGPLWIGFVVHFYFLAVAILSLNRSIPRGLITLPLLFYGAGIAVGVHSDLMASRWLAQAEPWLQVHERVPANTKFVTFDPWNQIEGSRLYDPAGNFRPEWAGFELALLKLHAHHGTREDDRLVVHSVADRGCRHAGRRAIQIGDRCFNLESIERPDSFLVLVGNQSSQPAQRTAWGTIYPSSARIDLRDGPKDTTVAALRGAMIRKDLYLLFPTAGCTLISSRAAWQCSWWIRARLRDQHVGFSVGFDGSSRDSAPLLMEAMRRLR